MSKRKHHLRRGNYIRILAGSLIILYVVFSWVRRQKRLSYQDFQTVEITGTLAEDAEVPSSTKRRKDISFRLLEHAAEFYLDKGSTAGDAWSRYDQLNKGRKVMVSIQPYNKTRLSDNEASIGIYALRVDGRRLLTKREHWKNNMDYDGRLGWLMIIIGGVIIVTGYVSRE